MRHDSVLTAPRRKAQRSGAKNLHLRWLALAPRRPRFYAALALGAALLGIVVNAVGLQHERHPAPFFAAATPTPVAIAARTAPAESTPASSSPGPTSAPATPPARPADLAVESAAAPPPRPGDPIGDLLRTGGKENSRLTITAQTALIKLGYSLKADGAAGPDTAAALRDFEKSRGLTLSTEITPRLVRLLTSAANSPTGR